MSKPPMTVEERVKELDTLCRLWHYCISGSKNCKHKLDRRLWRIEAQRYKYVIRIKQAALIMLAAQTKQVVR